MDLHVLISALIAFLAQAWVKSALSTAAVLTVVNGYLQRRTGTKIETVKNELATDLER